MRQHNQPNAYVPRQSQDVEELLEKISFSPERELSDEAKTVIYSIESQINKGIYGKDGKVVKELIDWEKSRSSPIDFILDYFDTEEGHSELLHLTEKYSISYEDFDKHDLLGVSKTIATISFRIKNDKSLEQALKRLANKSHDHYANQLCEQSEAIKVEPTHFTIHTNTENIISRISMVSSLRENLRFAKKDIIDREDLDQNIKEALLVIISAYSQKTSSILGELYPDYIDIYQICLLTSGEEKDILIKKLQQAQQSIYKLAEKISEEEISEEHQGSIGNRFAWTMDRWRQGVVKNHDNTPFSPELDYFAYCQDTGFTQQEQLMHSRFSADEIEMIDAITFNSQDVLDLTQYILRKNSLLSLDDNYIVGEWSKDSSRENPKIGVSVGPYPNLSYKKGWILIPEKLQRRARQQSPSGALLVVAHELEHALDGITSYQSKGLQLTEITSRGSTTIREGLGKAIEYKISEDLFGTQILPSLTYYKALNCWLKTGSEASAIITFAYQAAYESGLENPTPAQISNAENRVQRLISKHGLNSQALVYIEQALVAESLKIQHAQVRDLVSANSGIDLRTQAKLHEFGLLQTKRYNFRYPIIDTIEEYVRIKFINEVV